MDPYIGEIRIFAGNFAPVGWAMCNGQILSISQNTALFAILGVTYGGDGRTNFALPDLRSRVAIGMGQGSGLSPYTQGQVGGAEKIALLISNLPPHNHTFALQAGANAADQANPEGAIFAQANDGNNDAVYPYTKQAGTQTMAQQTTSTAGASQPVSALPPYLALNYIIALQGIYPSHS